MQAGEVIWLLAGIGIGLTSAMVILLGMQIVDGRRWRPGSTVVVRAPNVPIVAEAKTQPPARTVPPVPEPKRRPSRDARPPLAPMPVPDSARTAAPAPQQDAGKPVELVPAAPDALMLDLAEEIARVQVVESVNAVAEPPVEPVGVIAEPVIPVPPEPVQPADLPPPAETVAAAPMPEPPVAPPAIVEARVPKLAGKVPSLPKVTPARKFAPALPPRTPPAEGKT